MKRTSLLHFVIWLLIFGMHMGCDKEPSIPCPETIEPMMQVNGGVLHSSVTANVKEGANVSLLPEASAGGSWSWSGPDGFTASTREITIEDLQETKTGTYTATHISKNNCESTIDYVLTIQSSQSATTGDGFSIRGTQLVDANGNKFILKGLNVPTAWYVSSVNRNIENIKTNTNANCLRIVVTTSTLDSDWQESVNRCIASKMIPMVELHDVTCGTSISEIQAMAGWWASKSSFLTQPDIAKHILINIANEWGDWNMAANSPATWREGYLSAVSIIRNAGIKSTLVIDAPNCGQDVQNGRVLRNYGPAVMASDPEKNILFGIHMYCEWKPGGSSNIATGLQDILRDGIPVYVGEFGYQHPEGNTMCDVNETEILSTCQSLDIGWLAWSWKGNLSPVDFLDLSNDWAVTVR